MSRLSVVVVLVALLLVSPAAAQAGFVTRSSTDLRLDGKQYRFTGINIYNANNRLGCWYALGAGPGLGTSLDHLGDGAKVIRAWFFQNMATTGDARDWAAFDHTLDVAAAHGAKVIVTLTNQWPDCDGVDGGPGAYKTTDWYTTGYKQADPAGTTSYRDYVAEVAARYKDDPTVLAWQLINEAEVYPYEGGPCEPGAAATLKAWAADVSAVIKAVDPNHLVSLGTLGNGPCGTSYLEYRDVHDVAGIDVCEYHDYSAPDVAMPGDAFNGLQMRIDQCDALGKPLIVGEVGIETSAVGSWPPLKGRAMAFESKFRAQFAAGVDGELAWAWNKDGSSDTGFDIGPFDPVLQNITSYNTPSDGTVTRVSTDGGGAQAGARSLTPHITPDGRDVIFTSEARLAPEDPGGGSNCSAIDVYLKDTTTGAVELINVDNDGQLIHGPCGAIGDDITPDGRYVLFESDHTRSIGAAELYLRDRTAGTTRRLTPNFGGRNVNASITADGRHVLFASDSTTLGPAPCGVRFHLYVLDVQTGALEQVDGDNADGSCRGNGTSQGRISDDGRYVALQTDLDLLPADSLNGFNEGDVYLRDRQTGMLTPVSVDRAGDFAGAGEIGMSGDGSTIAFASYGTNFVDGDVNDGLDLYVWDRGTHAVELASTDGSGHQFQLVNRATLSYGGRFVAFVSGGGSKYDPQFDVYVHDRVTGRTERINGLGGLPAGGAVDQPELSASGSHVVFASGGKRYVAGDTNNADDIFVHHRSGPVEDPPPVTDADGDGVLDNIQGASPGSFADGATTGSITARNGLTVTVTDAPAPDGVRIVVGPGSGQVTLSLCGGFTVKLSAGTDATLTCGSVIVKVTAGSADVVLGGGISVVTIPAGAAAEVGNDTGGGTHVVKNLGTAAIALTVDGVSGTIAGGATTTLRTWDFVGFTQPVDNPAVLNVVKAGQAVPLRWRLLSSTGSPVTTLSTATTRVSNLDCASSTGSDALEEVAATGSALQNLGNGYYQLNWKTDKAYAGSCRKLLLDLGEGVSHAALFRFTK